MFEFLFRAITYEEVFLWYSNNAMGLWSKIKGKGTDLKGPQAVGQVLTSTSVHLYIELLFRYVLGIELIAFNNGALFL